MHLRPPILFLFASASFSQINDPSEVSEQMSAGKNTGWRIFIPHLTEKEVSAEWKKLMKDYDSKVEKVKKSDDLLAAGSIVPAFGNTQVDIYSQIRESKEGVLPYYVCRISG